MKKKIKLGPPRHAVLRAARRLSLPGVKGVCIWCGHRYYRWSYKAQDAHLSQCTDYQAAKRES